MKNIFLYKKIFIAICTVMIISLPSFSLSLDTSVDEQIRKQYDSTKLENTVLPPLPKIDSQTTTQTVPKTQSSSTAVPKTTPTVSQTVPQITKADPKDAIKIPKWTKFYVRSNQNISDWLRKGNSVSFTSYSPVYKRYISIQSGTVFKGLILDSHRPQKTGNGGLVVMKVTNMIYNGTSVPINAKITKANNKKIFFNNIKGKRKYMKSVVTSTNKGHKFFNKMMKDTQNYADGSLTVILTPITFVSGCVVYGANIIASPILALFSKGGDISIPSGSTFEIKLLDDCYIN